MINGLPVTEVDIILKLIKRKKKRIERACAGARADLNFRVFLTRLSYERPAKYNLATHARFARCGVARFVYI